MTWRQQGEHFNSGYHANGPAVSSIEGRSMGAMTIRNNDKSDCCPIKYPDPNSKEYCECVVGSADNFVCMGAIMLMVGAVVLVVGMGVGGVAFCVSHSDNYTLIISSGHHRNHRAHKHP